MAAGTPPDVSVYDRYTIAAAQARGIMMDIMPYFKTSGMKGDDQQPWCWQEVFRDGKLWGLPYSTDTRMVYVNRAHLVKAGTLSATINSNSQLIGMFAEKDLDWIVWPHPPAKGVSQTHTWSGGFANVLPTGVKNPDASFALAKYLADEDFQKVQNKTGGGRLPTIKAAAQDPYWKTVDPRVKQFLDQLPFSHIRPPIVQIAIMNRELDGDQGAEPAALRGEKAPRQALTEANDRVNQAIKEGRAD